MEGVNTEKLGKQFEDLGNALKNLNLKTILKLAAAAIPLAAFGVALLAFSIGVSAMEKTNTNELSTQFKSLGISLKSLNLKTMLKLAAVAIPLAAFGLSLIPLSKGLKKLKDVKANNLGSILESIGTGLKSFNRKATKTLTKIAKPLAYFGRGLIGVAKAAKTLIKTDLTKINKKFVDLFTAIVNALNTFDKDSTNILQKVGRPLAGFGAGLKNIVDATKEMSKEGSFSKKMVILAKGIREIGSVETVAAMDRLGNMRAELRAFSLGFAIFLELIPQIPSLNEIPIKSFNALSQVIQIIGSAETVAAMDRLGDMRAELRAFSLGLV
ncbi:MAG: hypothetical protein H8E13_19130 [Actinobacteria bacterium]|nr:hypothetical protein [Actinomycetota bacterium]